MYFLELPQGHIFSPLLLSKIDQENAAKAPKHNVKDVGIKSIINLDFTQTA